MTKRTAQIRRLFAQLRETLHASNPAPEPSDATLEARWLGCVLVWPELWSEGKLPLDAFQHPAHRLLFEAMMTVKQSGAECNDVPKLKAQLSQRGVGQQQVGLLLQEVMAAGGDFPQFDYYVELLRRRLAERQQAEDNGGGSGEIVRLEVGGGSPFQEFTTDELLAEQQPDEWLIPGVLLRHEPGVICGPGKCLKSSIAVDLGGALATGGKFLGEFAATRSFRVGFVSGTSKRRALTDLAHRWGESHEEKPQLVWSLTGDDLTEAKSLQHLRQWIARHQLEVVLIDPQQLFSLPKRAQATQLQTLVRCCLQSGATPIVCCETRKQIRPRAMDVADMASAACDGFARQWLLLNRRQTYQPGSGEHRLWLTIGGDAGQDGLWGVDVRVGDFERRAWTTTVRDACSLRDEAAAHEVESLHQRLESKVRLAFTNLAGGKITKTKVRDQCGMNGVKFAAAWDRLVAAGKIKLAPGSTGASLYPEYQWIESVEPKIEPVRSEASVAATKNNNAVQSDRGSKETTAAPTDRTAEKTNAVRSDRAAEKTKVPQPDRAAEKTKPVRSTQPRQENKCGPVPNPEPQRGGAKAAQG
ncbi:AAA family ATPase [Blastopirellula marina]|nr:AAA family ATPase [Blastopirellula marina]PTL44223.1 hypothetical protein C5Y97_13145 [Blastopirellula marina]